MDSRVRRFGFSMGRGWVLLLLAAGGLLLVGYWIGPLRPAPAQLELLAVDGSVAVPEVTAEPRRTAEGSLAFAVPLAVRNVGAATARPTQLVLNVPAQYRLMSTRGRLTSEVHAGVPLRRYVVQLNAPRIEPSEQTMVLPGVDTIYLEPDLPRYYCALQAMQVPEFSPAPSYNAEMISDVRIFYSFQTAGGAERHTGVLAVQLDPSLLQVTPASMPPRFNTVVREPEAPAPELGVVSFAGARAATCGDPEQPVQLYTVIWENRAGARQYVIFVDGAPRKRLYDMNSDGIVDFEMWDAGGDGRFEASREARYPVPEFLLPLPPRDPSMLEPDPERPDSAWLDLFHTPGSGFDRFARSDLEPHPQPVAVSDTAAADSAARPPAGALAGPAERATARTLADPAADLGPVPVATPQFLALFSDTLAGPFRFSQRAQAQTPDTVTAQGAQPGAVATPEPADTVAEEPPPRPAPRRRPPPLGRPVDQRR